MKLFSKFFWKYKWNIWYYNLKIGIHNLIIYFPVIWKMRTWDAEHSLALFSYSLKRLKRQLIINGLTFDEDINKISRAIELIDNLVSDNYEERCGWDYSEHANDYFLDNKPLTEQQEKVREHKHKVIVEAIALRQKEKDELFELLKYYDTWWD